MFDLLKKKLNAFAQQVKEKVQGKAPEKPKEAPKPAPEEKPAEQKPKKEKPAKKKPAKEEPIEKPISVEAQAGEKPLGLAEQPVPGKKVFFEKTGEERQVEAGGEEPLLELESEFPEAEAEMPAIAGQQAPITVVEEKRDLKPKISISGKIKAAIKGEVRLEEKDLAGLLWQLELSLLEADVEQTTAEEIARSIRERLVGKRIDRNENIEGAVKKEIGETLLRMMQTEQFDLLAEIRKKKEKPYKILFLGPNGAGKTTTIAKLSYLLQGKGIRVIWAAGDTFRAASIEQLEKHAANLGIRVVKHQYGADPAAVAFDAVKAAQGKGIDCVLIDSAGRQETNKNLMMELEKISRVIKPDLKIYVAEAFTGQALLQQAKEYDKIAGIDAFILTKADCDSKGGTTISLLYKMRKPVLFIGVGQEYKDLQRFEPEFVVKRAIG